MKIIGFNASPRKTGNTAWITEKILEGAREVGAETELFHFGGMDINPCTGCLICKRGGNDCVVNDDMQRMYREIRDSDALILGSPIYMGQMSAQAKMFTDRLFAHFSPRFSPHFKESSEKKKKLLLMFNQGNPDSEKFRAYFDYTQKIFRMLEFDVGEVQVVAGLRTESACEKTELHSVLKDVGRALLA